ncbi:MAG: hypothetical protein OXR72_13870 [Gemmatimonadota bacterium]|nr:hypothetical protein [Gemmatimonadota bacterium]
MSISTVIGVLVATGVLAWMAITIWKIHEMAPKKKATWSLILTLAGVGLSLAAVKVDEIRKAILPHTLTRFEKIEAKQDSLFNRLERAETERDSISAQIARVDGCIDQHFRSLKNRLP